MMLYNSNLFLRIIEASSKMGLDDKMGEILGIILMEALLIKG